MSLAVRATYRQGTLVPQNPLPLPEEAEVSLVIEGPLTIPPAITDQAERARILKLVAQSMQQNPLPAASPHFTREEIHGRR